MPANRYLHHRLLVLFPHIAKLERAINDGGSKLVSETGHSNAIGKTRDSSAMNIANAKIPVAVYASREFGQDLVGSPAIIMSLGVCSLYALRYVIQTTLGPQYASWPVQIGALSLGAFALYLIYLFGRQASIDRTVLWGPATDLFRIGTWVAALNVLARLISFSWAPAAWLCHALASAVWVMYIGWVLRMWRRGYIPPQICGTAFLSTVATQSIVLTAAALFPAMPAPAMAGLVALNLFGVVIYGRFFLLVWVRRGINAQIAHWVPPNNITHGALSISVLAAESLVALTVSPPRAIVIAIEAVWSLAALLFIAVLVIELSLLVRGKADLLRFRVVNWARAFTYGMLFACTYYGARMLPGTIMASVARPSVLMALAILVLAINAWEGGHELARVAIRAVRGSKRSSEF